MKNSGPVLRTDRLYHGLEDFDGSSFGVLMTFLSVLPRPPQTGPGDPEERRPRPRCAAPPTWLHRVDKSLLSSMVYYTAVSYVMVWCSIRWYSIVK